MKIVAATSNLHKLKEFRQILSEHEILSAAEVGFFDDIDETGETFFENALIKARALFRATGLPALADDSGLCVEALGGAPGVYSARYAQKYAPEGFGSGTKDEKNRAFLLKNLEHEKNRRAYFCCVAALVSGAGEIVCEGRTYGNILREERGEGGFGYDCLFLSEELGVTFAEASEEQKNSVSHRGKALAELIKKI